MNTIPRYEAPECNADSPEEIEVPCVHLKKTIFGNYKECLGVIRLYKNPKIKEVFYDFEDIRHELVTSEFVYHHQRRN
tara:strand:+ start:9711 stop:9944 length:234 start_codon:yes stop_codon:yes gene_type:complete